MGIVTAANSDSEQHHHWEYMAQVLLVFFPEDSPSSATATAPTKPLKRTFSNTNPIISRTQSTLSICALLLFFSLLLFTLSTFEPSIPTPTTSRRFLAQKPIIDNDSNITSWVSRIWPTTSLHDTPRKDKSFALQGMGRLFLRGTRASSDLVVAHVVEDTNEADFRLFLRLLHRSGLTSRADTVLLFHSHSAQSRFEALILEENHSFLKLLHNYQNSNRTSRDSVSVSGFDVTRFIKSGKKEMGEPVWGKRIRVSNSSEPEASEDESNRLSYGSVVGFEASELDPENSLGGFLDHVAMNMRRWACYPMLLGRLRRNFKHIMLVDAKNLVLLSDPLERVRSQSAESVYILTKQETAPSGKHRKNSDKTQSHPQVDSAVLMGGARGIRRFSSAMLTEIVRVVMQHKKKSSVSESGIFNQLVGNGHILKNINLITSTESIPDSSSLYSDYNSKYSIIQRGNTNRDLNSIIMDQICSCELDSSVYRDC